MGTFSRKRSDRAIRAVGGSILFLLALAGLIFSLIEKNSK